MESDPLRVDKWPVYKARALWFTLGSFGGLLVLFLLVVLIVENEAAYTLSCVSKRHDMEIIRTVCSKPPRYDRSNDAYTCDRGMVYLGGKDPLACIVVKNQE